MRSLPAWKRIGRKTLVYQAQGTFRIRVREFAIKIGDLRSEQQALVNDRSTGKGRNVEHSRVFDAGLPDLILRPLAHHIELALEGVFIHFGCTAHKNLLDVRLRSARHSADCGSVDRSVSPAQQSEALFTHDALKNSFAL